MKNFILICTLMLVFSLLAFAELYRRTAEDAYRESVKRQSEMNIAEIRADQYRSMYEVFDEHHNPMNAVRMY